MSPGQIVLLFGAGLAKETSVVYLSLVNTNIFIKQFKKFGVMKIYQIDF